MTASSEQQAVSSKKTGSSRISRTVSVCSLLIIFLLTASVVEAQQAKVARIGYLSDSNPARESARAETIRLALRDLGYIEGQNMITEYRYADGKVDRAPELAAELVRLNVDIIVIAGGDTQTRAAKNATATIPIVMMGDGANPVEAGFVESLAKPGGNVTGVTLLNRELGGKRLEVFKEAVPKMTRVAVLYDPANRNNEAEIKEILRVATQSSGLMIQRWPVHDANSLDKESAVMGKQRPDGLYVMGGRQMQAIEKQTAAFALKARLPSVYGRKDAVDAGGLVYYGANRAHSYQRVAVYVDRILKGAKPADLPVERPSKFELVINLKTAKQIGLIISPAVLARADRVIR